MSTEASAVNGTAPPARSTRDLSRAAMSGWLGTAMEFMDFQLYSLAAGLVFNTIFFPDVSPAIGLIAAMATYGVGYFARIAGAFYFGRMGDTIGRKKVLFITIAMMGGSTTLIGALPTYQAIGILAPILLVLLRLVQGFGAGAEIAGATVMLVEYAPKRRRGLISSLVALGTNTGTLVATGIWAVLLAVLSDEQLQSWGWRIPFLASFVLLVFALWVRRNVKESPAFEGRDDVVDGVALDRAELKKAETAHGQSKLEAGLKQRKGRAFVLALLLRLGQAGNSGLIQTFLVGYISSTLAMDKAVATDALLIGAATGFVTVPVIGMLSDRFGRRPVYMLMSGLSVPLAFPALLMITSGSNSTLMLGMILGYNVSVLGLFAVENVTMSEMFGGRNRFTQVGVAKELGGILGVGIGPTIAAALTAATGSWWPVAVMLIVYSLITFVTAYLAPEVRDRDLSALEDAA
ncbi:MHS family MFS transporter [Kineosporia sp. J2-2]|uniref:MHS family MFS transporter n=1 Tax=Kineosporia corallincola TaxID=2835133 RepID=A0ABS5TB14_9ACTN|nr:MFS transporter [Kineosporia corallincola]MBT0768267.1 MHS family MFS transporter [Kineosporia corallincola]